MRPGQRRSKLAVQRATSPLPRAILSDSRRAQPERKQSARRPSASQPRRETQPARSSGRARMRPDLTSRQYNRLQPAIASRPPRLRDVESCRRSMSATTRRRRQHQAWERMLSSSAHSQQAPEASPNPLVQPDESRADGPRATPRLAHLPLTTHRSSSNLPDRFTEHSLVPSSLPRAIHAGLPPP